MSHKDGRVVLSTWVDSVLRDYVREAARLSGMEFSRWVERAVRQTMARESPRRPRRTYDATTMEVMTAMPALPPTREDLVQAGRFMLRAYQLRARLRPDVADTHTADEERRVSAAIRGAHDVCAKMGGKR